MIMIYRMFSFDDLPDVYSDILTIICDMARVYYRAGQLNQAFRVLDAAQVFIEQSTGKEIKHSDRYSFTNVLSELLPASIFYQNTHLDKALPTLLLNRQLAEVDHNGNIDSQAVSDALENLGLAYYYHRLNTGEGDSSIALAYFQQALELREDTDNVLGKSESLFHIGLVYENGDQPDRNKALFYYGQAYQFAVERGEELDQSYAARHLGSIAEAQGDYEQAKHYYEESLALREKIDFKISFPFSHLALGDLYFTQKEWNSASGHYQMAVSFAREMDTPIALIASLLSLGDLRQAQNEPTQALRCLEEALALAQKLDATRWIPEATSRIEGSHF